MFDGVTSEWLAPTALSPALHALLRRKNNPDNKGQPRMYIHSPAPGLGHPLNHVRTNARVNGRLAPLSFPKTVS